MHHTTAITTADAAQDPCEGYHIRFSFLIPFRLDPYSSLVDLEEVIKHQPHFALTPFAFGKLTDLQLCILEWVALEEAMVLLLLQVELALSPKSTIINKKTNYNVRNPSKNSHLSGCLSHIHAPYKFSVFSSKISNYIDFRQKEKTKSLQRQF